MEIAKFSLMFYMCLQCNLNFAQNRQILLCDNLLFFKEISIGNKDTIEHIMISRITMNEDIVYTEQTLAIMFDNDSLFAINYERNPNFGREISIPLEDSCILYDVVSVDYFNELISDLIINLLNECQQNVSMNPSQSEKKYFDSLQKLLLILDSKQLDFLIEYCMYLNLDLLSLESHLIDAKNNNDKRKMFLISQAYRLNTYKEITKINFDEIWINGALNNGYDDIENLFKKRDMKRIGKVLGKNSKPFELKSTCWLGYI